MPSKIEWTDATWNPIRARNRETGKRGWFCAKVAPECAHCYAETRNINLFYGNGVRYAADQQSKVELYLDERVLEQPLHWRQPRMVFPCSMTDLFGEFVPFDWIAQMYAVMALAGAMNGHTFQVLTKRPERRLEFLTTHPEGQGIAKKQYPHIWEGVSAGTQSMVDRFVSLLLQTPAAVRWISVEPLLGSIDFSHDTEAGILSYLTRFDGGDQPTEKLDWVVVGGESGPGARPMHLEWARSLRDQCQAADVPFFFKQWGEWARGGSGSRRILLGGAGKAREPGQPIKDGEELLSRVGKKAAGRLLDGREWNGFPEART